MMISGQNLARAKKTVEKKAASVGITPPTTPHNGSPIAIPGRTDSSRTISGSNVSPSSYGSASPRTPGSKAKKKLFEVKPENYKQQITANSQDTFDTIVKRFAAGNFSVETLDLLQNLDKTTLGDEGNINRLVGAIKALSPEKQKEALAKPLIAKKLFNWVLNLESVAELTRKQEQAKQESLELLILSSLPQYASYAACRLKSKLPAAFNAVTVVPNDELTNQFEAKHTFSFSKFKQILANAKESKEVIEYVKKIQRAIDEAKNEIDELNQLIKNKAFTNVAAVVAILDLITKNYFELQKILDAIKPEKFTELVDEFKESKVLSKNYQALNQYLCEKFTAPDTEKKGVKAQDPYEQMLEKVKVNVLSANEICRSLKRDVKYGPRLNVNIGVIQPARAMYVKGENPEQALIKQIQGLINETKAENKAQRICDAIKMFNELHSANTAIRDEILAVIRKDLKVLVQVPSMQDGYVLWKFLEREHLSVGNKRGEFKETLDKLKDKNAFDLNKRLMMARKLVVEFGFIQHKANAISQAKRELVNVIDGLLSECSDFDVAQKKNSGIVQLEAFKNDDMPRGVSESIFESLVTEIESKAENSVLYKLVELLNAPSTANLASQQAVAVQLISQDIFLDPVLRIIQKTSPNILLKFGDSKIGETVLMVRALEAFAKLEEENTGKPIFLLTAKQVFEFLNSIKYKVSANDFHRIVKKIYGTQNKKFDPTDAEALVEIIKKLAQGSVTERDRMHLEAALSCYLDKNLVGLLSGGQVIALYSDANPFLREMIARKLANPNRLASLANNPAALEVANYIIASYQVCREIKDAEFKPEEKAQIAKLPEAKSNAWDVLRSATPWTPEATARLLKFAVGPAGENCWQVVVAHPDRFTFNAALLDNVFTFILHGDAVVRGTAIKALFALLSQDQNNLFAKQVWFVREEDYESKSRIDRDLVLSILQYGIHDLTDDSLNKLWQMMQNAFGKEDAQEKLYKLLQDGSFLKAIGTAPNLNNFKLLMSFVTEEQRKQLIALYGNSDQVLYGSLTEDFKIKLILLHFDLFPNLYADRNNLGPFNLLLNKYPLSGDGLLKLLQARDDIEIVGVITEAIKKITFLTDKFVTANFAHVLLGDAAKKLLSNIVSTNPEVLAQLPHEQLPAIVKIVGETAVTSAFEKCKAQLANSNGNIVTINDEREKVVEDKKAQQYIDRMRLLLKANVSSIQENLVYKQAETKKEQKNSYSISAQEYEIRELIHGCVGSLNFSSSDSDDDNISEDQQEWSPQHRFLISVINSYIQSFEEVAGRPFEFPKDVCPYFVYELARHTNALLGLAKNCKNINDDACVLECALQEDCSEHLLAIDVLIRHPRVNVRKEDTEVKAAAIEKDNELFWNGLFKQINEQWKTKLADLYSENPDNRIVTYIKKCMDTRGQETSREPVEALIVSVVKQYVQSFENETGVQFNATDPIHASFVDKLKTQVDLVLPKYCAETKEVSKDFDNAEMAFRNAKPELCTSVIAHLNNLIKSPNVDKSTLWAEREAPTRKKVAKVQAEIHRKLVPVQTEWVRLAQQQDVLNRAKDRLVSIALTQQQVFEVKTTEVKDFIVARAKKILPFVKEASMDQLIQAAQMISSSGNPYELRALFLALHMKFDKTEAVLLCMEIPVFLAQLDPKCVADFEEWVNSTDHEVVLPTKQDRALDILKKIIIDLSRTGENSASASRNNIQAALAVLDNEKLKIAINCFCKEVRNHLANRNPSHLFLHYARVFIETVLTNPAYVSCIEQSDYDGLLKLYDGIVKALGGKPGVAVKAVLVEARDIALKELKEVKATAPLTSAQEQAKVALTYFAHHIVKDLNPQDKKKFGAGIFELLFGKKSHQPQSHVSMELKASGSDMGESNAPAETQLITLELLAELVRLKIEIQGDLKKALLKHLAQVDLAQEICDDLVKMFSAEELIGVLAKANRTPHADSKRQESEDKEKIAGIRRLIFTMLASEPHKAKLLDKPELLKIILLDDKNKLNKHALANPDVLNYVIQNWATIRLWFGENSAQAVFLKTLLSELKVVQELLSANQLTVLLKELIKLEPSYKSIAFLDQINNFGVEELRAHIAANWQQYRDSWQENSQKLAFDIWLLMSKNFASYLTGIKTEIFQNAIDLGLAPKQVFEIVNVSCNADLKDRLLEVVFVPANFETLVGRANNVKVNQDSLKQLMDAYYCSKNISSDSKVKNCLAVANDILEAKEESKHEDLQKTFVKKAFGNPGCLHGLALAATPKENIPANGTAMQMMQTASNINICSMLGRKEWQESMYKARTELKFDERQKVVDKLKTNPSLHPSDREVLNALGKSCVKDRRKEGNLFWKVWYALFNKFLKSGDSVFVPIADRLENESKKKPRQSFGERVQTLDSGPTVVSSPVNTNKSSINSSYKGEVASPHEAQALTHRY